MKAFLFISSLFLFLLSLSCDPGDTVNSSLEGPHLYQSELSPYKFSGTVIDAVNNPVQFANVHFLFKDYHQFGKTQEINNPTPSTRIQFVIPDSGYTTIKMFRLGTRELIQTLLDTIVRPGFYTIGLNTSLFSNGFYVYEVKGENFFSQDIIEFSLLSTYEVIETKPLIKTDFQGKFFLPIGVFALEEKFVRTDDQGNEIATYTISDSVGFVFYRGYGEPTVQWIKINKYSNTEKTFVMK